MTLQACGRCAYPTVNELEHTYDKSCRIRKLKKKKVPCDCKCSGPFCSDLVHCKNTRLHIAPVQTSFLKSFIKYLRETYGDDDLPIDELEETIEDFLAIY